jgi:transaldolase
MEQSMAIFLDSAIHAQVREAMAWGFIAGITTNPALLAEAGDTSLDALPSLCELVPGRVFYQLTSHGLEAMLLEGQAAFGVSPSQVVLKVPCTLEGLRVVARMSLEIPCAVTTIFGTAQAILAREAGARYIVPYLDRSTRLMGDGVSLICSMAQVLSNGATEILVGSIHSPADAVEAVKAGADHLALPLHVIKEMADHPLSQQIIEEFDRLINR